jgi:hypothetical protein
VEELITKILTQYGPLGMGWAAAWHLARQNQALQDKVLTSFVADTQAKAEMKNALDALATIVKGH